MKFIAGMGMILAIASLLQLSRIADEGPRVIGSIETIIEAHSNIPFLARVDTGATTCSMHFESLHIYDAAVDPQDNVGKRIRFLVKNRKGQSTIRYCRSPQGANVRGCGTALHGLAHASLS